MEQNSRVQKLIAAGYSQEQIATYVAEKQEKLRQAGYDDSAIQQWTKDRWGMDYTGLSIPSGAADMYRVNGPTQTYLEPAPDEVVTPTEERQRQAKAEAYERSLGIRGDSDETFWRSLVAGYQTSVTGFMMRGGEAPSVIMGEDGRDVGLEDKAGFAFGRQVGDLWANVAGFFAGGGPASPVTGTGGAFALPEAIRHTYIQSLEEGKVNSIQDFMIRLGETFWTTTKAYTVGVATGGAGKLSAAALPAGKAYTPALSITAEVGTATVASAGLEGRVPTTEDFLVNGLTVAGTKVAMGFTQKPARYMTDQAKIAWQETGFNLNDFLANGRLTPMDTLAVRSKNLLLPPDIAAQVGGLKALKKASFETRDANIVLGTETTSRYAPKNAVDRLSQRFWQHVFKNSKHRAYEAMFDALDPLRQASEPGAQGLYQLARKIPGFTKRADRAIHRGLFSLATGKRIGPGLKEILRPIKDRRAFEEFVRARQAAALKREGGKPVKRDEAIKLENIPSEWNTAYKQLLKYRENLIAQAAQAGYFSKETAALLKQRNDTFVPLRHQFGRKGQKPLAADELMNPVETVLTDVYHLYRAIEVNKVFAQAFEIFGRKPTEKKPTKSDETEVLYEIHGDRPVRKIDSDEAAEILPETATTSFVHEGKYVRVAMPKDIVRALESLHPSEMNSIVKILSIPAKATRLGTILDPAFMARMTGIDLALAPIFSKNNFRFGIDHVLGAGTLLGQFVNRYAPGWFKESAALYERAINEGAFGASYISADIAPTALRALYKVSPRNMITARDLKDVTLALDPRVSLKYGTHRLVNTLGRVTEVVDTVARMGEFKRAKQAGKSDSAAAFDAREINLDFARMGAQTQALNSLTAFFNPAMQGLDKFLSMAKNQPTTLLKRGAMLSYASFLHAMAKWDAVYNSPDSVLAERVLNESQVDRDFYWTFYNVDGDSFKLKAPFEVAAIFKMPIESFVRHMYEDAYNEGRDTNFLEHAIEEGVANSMLETFVPPFIPNVAYPVLEPWTNFNLFQDRPMIPGWAERLTPQLRTGTHTTELGRNVSYWLNTVSAVANSEYAERYTSPIAIDHLITSWTGGAGRTALELLDKGLQVTGIVDEGLNDWSRYEEIPVIRSFVVRHPNASSTQVVKARKRLLDYQEDYNSFKYLAEMGEYGERITKQLLQLPRDASLADIQKAESQIMNPSQPIRQMGEISRFIRHFSSRKKFSASELDVLFSTMSAMGRNGQTINRIYQAEGHMTPDLRDMIIDDLNMQLIKLAEQINEQLDAWEKNNDR